MGKWQRSLYQPVLPLGKDGRQTLCVYFQLHVYMLP